MHEACHVPVTSLDLAVHAQLLDSTRLSGFSQSQSSDSQKHKFYFNPFRDNDITRESLQFYCFSNWLPVTEKVPTGEKSFALLLLLPECRPASRASSVHRFSTLVRILARHTTTSHHRVCGEMPVHQDHPAQNSPRSRSAWNRARLPHWTGAPSQPAWDRERTHDLPGWNPLASRPTFSVPAWNR